jgi:hypothetical protein
MSRSNGPATPKTGWPSPRHPGQDQDHHATRPSQRWPQQNGQPANQGYRQQPQGYAQQGNGWPSQQQGYHVPQTGGHAPQQYDPYAGQRHQQPTLPVQPAHNQGGHNAYDPSGHHGYVPTLDPYQSPTQSGYGQDTAGYGQESAYPDYGHHGHQQPSHGYDQWQSQNQVAPDPRGYDLGSYMPNTLDGNDPAGAMANEWALNQGYPAGGGHPDDELFDADGYPQARGGALAAHSSYADEEFHDDEDYEDEPPRRRGRMLLVLTALVGAVGVGGALAYGYNSLIGPAGSGNPPVIKSAAGPVKSKPADPGGKQFSYTDSKVMGRLGDNSSVTTTTGSVSDSSSDSDGGTRRVQTVVVGRDGTISQPEPPPSSSGSVSVPGLTLTDGFGRQMNAPHSREPERAEAPPPAKPMALTPPATPQRPVVIAKAEPSSQAKSDATDDYAERPAPPKKAASKKPVVTAAVSPTAHSSSSGSGYVAVLASVPASSSSRLDALKRFADMQQKYGSALENKTPDVQEANLGDKGIYHRLVVGPPGSREAANSVCSQLKTAGYTNCWVLAY